MGTDESLNSKENIAVICFMEEEVIKLARAKGFSAIFSINTSSLTQHFASNVFGYERLLQYQINKYVHHDGIQLFAHARDSEIVTVDLKNLD
jgi:hypothetical protein